MSSSRRKELLKEIESSSQVVLQTAFELTEKHKHEDVNKTAYSFKGHCVVPIKKKKENFQVEMLSVQSTKIIYREN